MLYLFNNTENKLIFEDVGLEIESHSFFELKKNYPIYYFKGCSLDDALDNLTLLMTLTDQDNPPLVFNILNSEKAKFVLSSEESAFEIHYFDTTNLLANNVQTAIEKIDINKITEAPNDNKLYGRRNKNWIEMEVFSGASPSGNNGDIQFNTDDVFDSSINFNYDKNENKLVVSKCLIRPVNNKVGVWII